MYQIYNYKTNLIYKFFQIKTNFSLKYININILKISYSKIMI